MLIGPGYLLDFPLEFKKKKGEDLVHAPPPLNC